MDAISKAAIRAEVSLGIAIAAAITGLAALALPIGLPLQLLLFAALSIVAVYAGRRWYVDHPVASTDPLLNDRAARLIGHDPKPVGLHPSHFCGQGRIRRQVGTVFGKVRQSLKLAGMPRCHQGTSFTGRVVR